MATYPFQWLDDLVENRLNPNQANQTALTDEEIQTINDKIDEELCKAHDLLKKITFTLRSTDKIKTLLYLFSSSLKVLLAQAEQNQVYYLEGSLLAATGKHLIDNLNHLSAAIDKRFPGMLWESTTIKSLQRTKPDIRDEEKLLCKLSVDQMGLILKAADDAKVVIARSMSLVFKSLVPYLSTDRKRNLSWDSMRSNTYNAEDSDKDAAIKALEMMIKKIKAY